MSISLVSWRYSPPDWMAVRHDLHEFKVRVRVMHGELSEDLEIADWTSDENFRKQCLLAKERLMTIANVTRRLAS